MRPISLKLSGFKGIRSNSGKDEVFHDFSGLKGLIALAGPNGAGKTTILDNLHPYRIMPYRAGSYSPRSFSFYNECYSRRAQKDLHFEANGDTYRSLLLIDAEKKKQEAYLFKRIDGEWKSLCDGKIDTYDRTVNLLFGSPQLFFTSVFRCQDAAKLSDYTKGEIKDIFVELLGIESLKEIGIRARGNKDLLLQQLNKMKIEKDTLSTEIETAKAASKEVKLKKKELITVSNEVKETENQIDEKQTELQKVKSKLAVQETLIKERKSLENESKQMREKMSGFRKITSMAGEIRQASRDADKTKNQIHALKKELAEVEKVVENLNVIFSDLKGVETEIAEKKRSLSEHTLSRKHNFDIKKKELELAQKKKNLLRHVPCGNELHEKCPLLNDAVSARNSIVQVIPTLHKLKQESPIERRLASEITALKEKIKSMQNIQKNLNASNKEREEIKNRIVKCEKEIEEARKLGRMLPELEVAEKSVAELETGLKKIEEKLSSIKTNANLKQKESEVQNALENLKAQRKDLLKKEAGIRESLGFVESQVKRGKDAEKKIKGVNSSIKAINSDISEWSILEKAFSNDGIIALEIDDAGPTISAIANDLLQSCFGSRFSVKIDTQVAKSDGKGLKETFDIVIYDTERDESKSLKSMSGGEKIWIEEGVTRAISLYNSMKSGRKFLTLFTDEKDGALDFQKKKEFMMMKRKVLEIGGYDMELFISQSPEVQEIADYTLKVA
jgi:exonuclease SbcC